MIRALLFTLLTFSAFLTVFGQNIISGPMPGYKTMTEVAIWLQSDRSGSVSISYWEQGSPDSKFKSDVYPLHKKDAFTAELTISNLSPGTTYDYQVFINDVQVLKGIPLSFSTQVLWQFRTDPPTFKVAIGSCTYVNEEEIDRPGKIYGGGYEIYESIANAKPDMMLWLGDNTYLREVDWNSRSGYLHRYTHTRALPEMQTLLRTTHHYAIWDDHEFGPNDANGSWLHKDWALEAFDLFWANPTTGTPDLVGITSAFEFNDIDFVLLDNRYHRSSDNLVNRETQILGKDQIEWLIEILKYSRAPFKMVAVGGQFLNDAAVYETHAVYGSERQYLIDRIVEEKIQNVIFLTGDRHHTELSRYAAENGITIYDLTVSPLTAGTHSDANEKNSLQVEHTLVSERNFGVLEFSGPRKDRSMKISIFDQNGLLKWEKRIESND
jgi:alkaline phosphatase D